MHGTFHVCNHQDGTRSGFSTQRFCENRSAQSPSCQCFKSFIPVSPFKVKAADIQNIFALLSPGAPQVWVSRDRCHIPQLSAVPWTGQAAPLPNPTRLFRGCRRRTRSGATKPRLGLVTPDNSTAREALAQKSKPHQAKGGLGRCSHRVRMRPAPWPAAHTLVTSLHTADGVKRDYFHELNNPQKLKAAAVHRTSQLSKVGTGTNYVAREHP